MGLSGYKNTQRGRLGAHRSLNVICRRVIRNFLKCYIYCMSGPSLHSLPTLIDAVHLSGETIAVVSVSGSGSLRTGYVSV